MSVGRVESDKPTDGYWLRMGTLAVDSLSEVLRQDLTVEQRQQVAECLGGIFDDAYRMGMRLGQLKSELGHRDR